MSSLREFVTECAARASAIFERDGKLEPPFWDAMTRAGERLFLPAIPGLSKSMMVALVRELFASADVVRYVWISEAWMLQAKDDTELDRYDRDGIEHEPGRIEALMFSAEDAQEGMLIARREIKRDQARPRLGPLIIADGMSNLEGRMVGLLPAVGTRQ